MHTFIETTAIGQDGRVVVHKRLSNHNHNNQFLLLLHTISEIFDLLCLIAIPIKGSGCKIVW